MKQRYDSYKPTGIDWIGEIPSHWMTCRIKDCFNLKTGTTPNGFDKPINDEEVNWFTPSDIESTGTILTAAERKLSKGVIQEGGISLFPKGSLIFVGIGATAGKLGYTEIDAYSNQQITALIPKDICSKYYFYYLCQDSKRVKDNATYTTLPIINNTYLSQVYWILPPLSEQEAIATWLDEKCQAIDASIAKVDREIELIDELKQSEISHVVTRGLNPDVPLRPSGIKWIGDVPAHWSILPLKRISDMFGRIGYRGYTIQDLTEEGNGAITLSPSNMVDGRMDYSNVSYLRWYKYHESPEIKIQYGDILYVKTGSTFGKTAFVDNLPMEATINPQILRIVPSINK